MVYLTSKLDNLSHRPDDARRAFDRTLQTLGFDYVDLFLIHWPLPTSYGGDFTSTWRTLEEFYRDSRARSIGVSNFQVAHLRRLAAEGDVVPAVNQIEVHPYFGNEEVRTANAEQGSSPRPGRRSLWVGFLRIRELERSLAGSAGLRLRSCFAGTFNVAT